MKIGALAKRAGVTTDTVRYYEKEGLLSPPPRTPGGYRDYEESVLDDLLFIRKAQALGLRLGEVREVMEIAAGGQPPCDHVRATVRSRLSEVERRIGEMKALRGSLREVLRRLERVDAPPPGCRCAAIEADPEVAAPLT